MIIPNLFKPDNIKWVKNVKRDDGTAWAYYEDNTDQTFILNFSKTQIKRGNLVKPGEIILLFQKVDKLEGISPKTYLTHLVTPVDNQGIVEEKNSDSDFRWGRKVAVVAKASLDSKIYTTPIKLNFFKPNWGKVCPISLLHSKKSEDEIQREVWNLFRDQFNPNILRAINIDESSYIEDFTDEGFLEGKEREVFKKHLIRERSPAIINLAKSRAMEQGRIKCECCGFDFFDFYGAIGLNFIECHHKLPIAKGGERYTRPEDLALVCSNCHRMLHRKLGKEEYQTIESLKGIVQKNK